MDTQIRNLLTISRKHGSEKGGPALQQAYDLLRNVAETRLAVDAPESFGQDLYIICAEVSFQHGRRELAKECLKMYFMKTPPTNQFLCRAYLCQAQLLAPKSADNPDQLEKAVVYLIKAINMSKENPRYHFLVYNASVLYWQFCRPFLKLNYRQYLARSLHQVVKALDDIDDKDYEWRAELMIALIECHMDAGRRSDASHIAAAASSFIKQHVSHLYKTVFGLMVRYQLVEPAKLQKDLKASPELNIYYKICRLKLAIDQQDPEKELAEEMGKIVAAIKGQETESNTSVSKPSTAKGRRSATPEDRPFLLMELGRLAIEQNIPSVASQCVELIKECSHLVKEQGFPLELEFLQCELMVTALGDQQESYAKSVVEVRQQAIKRCEEAIINAVRLGAPHIIQAGCVTQWNLCLPLVQPNLRQSVRRPLTVVAEALEDMQSLLMLLRCQVHMELAKCEEDQEQIQGAMTHLKKALALDDGKIYEERLLVALRRLELRSELYTQPERAEDQAAMIIEQARKADSGTVRMKRSLLVKVGEALAPDTFLLVLDSESNTKEVTSSKGPLTQINKLGGRARNYIKCTKKAAGHLRRLGDENDRERGRLWGDLAKTARKQEVWDVCRVAARFCLLYDDGRWKNEPPVSSGKEEEGGKPAKGEGETAREKSSSRIAKDKDSGTGAGSRPASPEPGVPLYDKDLIRMLVEVNFIQGESLIHLLRSEHVELGELPIPPEDKRLRPKGYIAKKPEEDPDWVEYCEWIKSLSDEAVASFLRAVELGVELGEAWAVCSSAAYVWNYNNHILAANRHHSIVPTLTALLDGLKKVGHAGETVLLVHVCNALAQGIIQPWLPTPQTKESVMPSGDEAPLRGSAKKRGAAAPNNAKKPTEVKISAEATPDLKKALEVCEYAMRVTNGDSPLDVVAISVRQPLLQTWVLIKQMLLSQITKGLGTEDETNNEGQNPATRAMVAVEMIQLSSNGVMEFKDAPSVGNAVEMVSGCVWSDRLIELQMWTRLATLAYDTRDHTTVHRCATKALTFAQTGTQSKKTAKKGDKDKHKYSVEQELLSHASSLYGQSLVDTAHGKNSVRRNAMMQFLNSAKFACAAGNGALVMQAARLYWNACLPLLNQPIERELLMEPLTTLLHAINVTTDKKAFKKDENEGNDSSQVAAAGDATPGADASAGAGESGGETGGLKPVGIIGGPEDDLTLRAALYGVLFQAYADKGEWEAGLKAMDQAIADMPRTNHRLLIFKHMVTVKAKLGLNVSMSIQKFKDESEDYVAQMWRRVALCSKEPVEQLQAYQYAIEALSSSDHDWQKFDYLLEFGQWLFCNEFSLQDSLDQLEWASDILLNMKYESDKKEEPDAKAAAGKGKKAAKGKGKEKTKSPPPSAKPPPPKAAPPPAKSASREVGTPDTRSQTGSGSEMDINAADYIPVQKDVIIGLVPANPSLTVADLSNVRQLEGLMRSHTMKAQIAGRDSMYHADYAIMAYGYVMRIWQVSVGSCGGTLKEIAKNPPAPADNASGKGGSAKGKAAAAKGGKPEPVKEKPKRKGPLDWVPTTCEDWACFDVAEEVSDAFRHELMKTTGINKFTVTKPALTMHYLGQLVTNLRELGFHHLALPVLALAEFIARDIIKHRALTSLMHLRLMEVCLEMNLQSGVSFHEKMADFSINEEEQAMSREEMALWKERQLQVNKEEAKLREAMAKQVGKALTKNKPSGDGGIADKAPSAIAAPHLGRQVGLISLQEVWTDTAEVLIRQTMYNPARHLLSEAYQAAKAFNDVPLQARVLLLLSRLSYEEAQFGQAVNLADQAQKLYEGDEMYWFEAVMIMVDATVDDYNIKDGNRQPAPRYNKARDMLIHALTVFSNLAELRPNKISVIGCIIARMKAKLGSIQARLAFCEHDNIMKPKVIETLKSAGKTLSESSGDLVRLGYKREAVNVYKEHADIIAHMARAAHTEQDKHTYFLKALSLYRECCRLTEDILYDVHSSATLLDLRSVNTPVQRESAEMKLKCCSLMLEMMAIHSKQQRYAQRQEQRKNSVVKAVEELIRETPDYTDTEREWINCTRTLGDEVLSNLTAVHSMITVLPEIKCKTLCLFGRCLRIISEQRSPDAPCQWNVMDSAIMNVAQHLEKHTPGPEVGEGEENVPEDQPEELDKTSKQYMKYAASISKLKASLGTCHQYLAQATEVLSQALNLALTNSFNAEAGAAALELVECIGQHDPSLSTQLLALHQSCVSSTYMEGLVGRSLVDPRISQTAALFNQRAKLRENIATNGQQGFLYQAVVDTLNETSHAWKRLAISPHHLDLMKDLPPNLNFIVFQHSPNREYLYGAVLDKPKPSQAAGGGGKGHKNTALQSSSKAKIVRLNTSASRIDELLTRFKWLKSDIAQVLLKAEYQRSQAAQRRKMLANLDESLKTGNQYLGTMNKVFRKRGLKVKSTQHMFALRSICKITPMQPELEELEDEETPLQEEFLQILNSMEEYFRPITSLLEHTLRPSSATTVSNDKNPKTEPAPSQEFLVLLADRWLLELPLEALKCLQNESYSSLTRDVSLQMLHHRMMAEPLDEAAEKAKKEKEKVKPPTRIPGLRDAAKKMAKIIPLDRAVPAGCVPVDTHAFRYFVDPHLDCSETEEKAPIDLFNKLIELHEQQFTPRWLGVMGNEHAASTGEYEVYIKESSALLFYGMERFLNYLPPAQVAALNLTDCQMVMLFDLAQTNKSFLRQSKMDVLKTADVLKLEKPVETAMLLSLTGINCVFLNQWHCTLQENADKLHLSMNDMLSDGKLSGQVMRMMFTPYQRKVESEPVEEVEGDAASAKGREKDTASPGKSETHTEGSDSHRTKLEEEPEPEPVPRREWFNMVCYGAPNLLVAQVSKP